MNKMINVNNESRFTKQLLRHGGEYRVGYLDALMELEIIRRCNKCGRLFYPDRDHRTTCGKKGCEKKQNSSYKSSVTAHKANRFATIVQKLQYRADKGDADSARMLQNFLNSYALCETKKERDDLIYMWLSEYPSLRCYGRSGRKGADKW